VPGAPEHLLADVASKPPTVPQVIFQHEKTRTVSKVWWKPFSIVEYEGYFA